MTMADNESMQGRQANNFNSTQQADCNRTNYAAAHGSRRSLQLKQMDRSRWERVFILYCNVGRLSLPTPTFLATVLALQNVECSQDEEYNKIISWPRSWMWNKNE